MSSKPTPTPNPSATKAGIVTDTSTQDRYIPSSVRPDGTTRREIKIRPGYRPPEDVEVYKNRTAEAFKSRGSGGIPGVEELNGDDEKGSAASEKNRKRREARRRAKEMENGVKVDGDVTANEVNGIRDAKSEEVKTGEAEPKTEALDEDAEKEKKARTLKKKLRQARELSEKKEKGDVLLPEQFEKVIKIQELIRQLESLGFDADGEKKEKLG